MNNLLADPAQPQASSPRPAAAPRLTFSQLASEPRRGDVPAALKNVLPRAEAAGQVPVAAFNSGI